MYDQNAAEAEVVDTAVEAGADINEVIEEAVAPKAKRERKPKLDAEGNVTEKKVRAPKEPKAPKLYPQYNEDGSQLLDEAGEPVMLETKMAKPKKAKVPKAPRLDADGNPIVGHARVVPTAPETVLYVNVAKIAGYKGARAEQATMLVDGMTLGAFTEAGGDKGFLRFYMRDGAVSLVPFEFE